MNRKMYKSKALSIYSPAQSSSQTSPDLVYPQWLVQSSFQIFPHQNQRLTQVVAYLMESASIPYFRQGIGWELFSGRHRLRSPYSDLPGPGPRGPAL